MSLKNKNLKTIIYGAGNAGKQVCNLILDNNNPNILCFIDDNPKKFGKIYRGIKIYNKKYLYKFKNLDNDITIIIAIPSLKNIKLKKLFKFLYSISSNVLNLPLKSEFNSDKITLSDLQRSELIHIFKRKENKKKKINLNQFRNKVALVTGGGGSIGSELTLQLSKYPFKKIYCLDNSELALFKLKINLDKQIIKKITFILGSINDLFLIENIIIKKKIDFIFHTAAYKHLNFLENNPIQAVKNNILGTLNLLEKSIKSNRKIKFINISTDKAVKPISVLGFTKRISEIICSSLGRSKSFNTSISTVRFGNVFGSDGSVVNIFIDKINNNQIVPITDKKAERFFMSIAEACNLIISASLLKKNGSTYIFNMGKPVKILDLYKKIFFIKKFKDKNLKMKIKFIGLQKGEKLKEKILLKKKMNKTKIQDVYEVFDPIYSRSSVIQIIDNIKKKINTSAESRIIEDIKIFLKNEIN